jgi:hypothetical protein
MRTQASRIVVGFTILLLVTGNAFGRKVKVDYDHGINFSKYRTFVWIEEPEPKNPFMKQRIIKAINSQLRLKGLEPDDSKADLEVKATSTTEQVQILNTYYSGGGCAGWGWGYGGCWDGWGGGWSTTTVENREQATLVVELLDAKTHEPLWQGVSTHLVSRKTDKAVEKLQKEIRKMFEQYPGWSRISESRD